MNFRNGLLLMVIGLTLSIVPGAIAQTKDVSVSFLRAAASSLSDRANVSFDAVYLAEQGMTEPQTWNMKGRGLSRFSVRDPKSPVVFANMYCTQDSKAFRELVGLSSNRVVHINGYKDKGENNDASIYVTSVEVLASPVTVISGEQAVNAKSFRVIVKDTTSGNRTVLVNVVPGKTYTLDNMTIAVEVEKEAPSAGVGQP